MMSNGESCSGMKNEYPILGMMQETREGGFPNLSPLPTHLQKRGLPINLKLLLIKKYIGDEIYSKLNKKTREYMIRKAKKEFQMDVIRRFGSIYNYHKDWCLKHGFKSVYDYQTQYVKSYGFSSYEEYLNFRYRKKGYKNRSEAVLHRAKELGFNSINELNLHRLKKRGFVSIADYKIFLARKKGFKSYSQLCKHNKKIKLEKLKAK